MRKFHSGATRDIEDGKLDYEAFLSPLVLERYARYMHQHRTMKDGSTRSGDDWQRGIPLHVYIKSAFRHFMDWWKAHRNGGGDVEEALCAVIFNAMGYLHEVLKARRDAANDRG